MESIVNNIQVKINNLLVELGFEIKYINDKECYLKNNSYYKITYLNSLNSFVIEYADSYEEAYNNLFEDGDTYPISQGESELIKNMRSDLINNYI